MLTYEFELLSVFTVWYESSINIVFLVQVIVKQLL